MLNVNRPRKGKASKGNEKAVKDNEKVLIHIETM